MSKKKKNGPAVNTDSERPKGDVEQTLGNISKNSCSSSCLSNRYFWLWMNSEIFWDDILNNRIWLLFSHFNASNSPSKNSVLTLYLQVNKKLFVMITLQLCVSPCLALIAEGNRACFIMPINWVNWLILISCFLNLMRDSASLGKHIILQQDQKQRKPDNKSFGFQRMFTGKLSVFWPELGQTTGFVSKFADSCAYFADGPENTSKTELFLNVSCIQLSINSMCFVWKDKKVQKSKQPTEEIKETN